MGQNIIAIIIIIIIITIININIIINIHAIIIFIIVTDKKTLHMSPNSTFFLAICTFSIRELLSFSRV